MKLWSNRIVLANCQFGEWPTSPEDAAFECAFLVSDGLTLYVKTHDALMKEQATFMSLIRSVMGGGPDFHKLLQEARSINDLWTKIQNHVQSCFKLFENGFSKSHRDFFSALLPWVDAVLRTTTLLVMRQESLLKKLEGSPLSLDRYRQIDREYSESIEAYMRLGATLQPLMDQLFALQDNR